MSKKYLYLVQILNLHQTHTLDKFEKISDPRTDKEKYIKS